MADQKKMVEEITSMDQDFAKWYTDVVKKAELCDYSPVKGCIIFRPYGYAIWENIKEIFDGMIKESGHENVYMPMFIPESLLKKEAEHVEGFAPEVAWVTHGGSERLTERLCIRPTSEVLFCTHYKDIVESYRDLPKLYNQWCSVVRWEKTTRPFLRTSEFLWQEGHTLHENSEQAMDETIYILERYAELCEKYLAIPVIQGKKTDKEKFAGAQSTYTIEAMMHDGKSLQSGTSHYFGDGFARTFDIKFVDRENKLQTPHQTSWGISTRLIGAIIMSHGDNNGLVLPPAIAPTQVVVIPVAQHKEGVVEKATEIKKQISKFCRAKIDDRDYYTPGWKYSEYEMKGVPLRLELGPKDIEKNQCVIVRRDTREKYFVSLDELETKIPELLQEVHNGIFNKALANREKRMFQVNTLEEMKAIEENGFIKSMWCGGLDCELQIKEEVGLSSRCMPFDQTPIGDTCVCCGKKAEHVIYWGKAY